MLSQQAVSEVLHSRKHPILKLKGTDKQARIWL